MSPCFINQQKDYYTALIDKSDIRVLLSKEDSGQDLPEQSVCCMRPQLHIFRFLLISVVTARLKIDPIEEHLQDVLSEPNSLHQRLVLYSVSLSFRFRKMSVDDLIRLAVIFCKECFFLHLAFILTLPVQFGISCFDKVSFFLNTCLLVTKNRPPENKIYLQMYMYRCKIL